MRYPIDHKDASRQRLIKLSGSHAKKHGFSASGVASLAASAGVTTGALYKHFGGKSELFSALVTDELTRTAAKYDAFDSTSAARLLVDYLSLEHVNHPEQGCPLPALTAEIARADDATKDAFRTGLLGIHATLRRLTTSSEDAWTLMAQNVGAVMLTRAIPDEGLQQEILSVLRKAGERLLADTGARAPSPSS